MDADSSGSEPTSLPITTDKEIWQALKARKPAALALLYDTYAGLVYGLALKLLKHPQEAEDLTQEVFLAFWHNDVYHSAHESLNSILLTMTRSLAIAKLRSRDVALKDLERWRQSPLPEKIVMTPFEQASLQERSQQIEDGLVQLSHTQRQALEMAYFEGFSQAEIAKQLGIPLGTVKTRVRQGLLKLKQTLRGFI
ncbi:MAG: sigma-70 family RNA polymerase sigma factor [Trichocoleus desertorum ATA4-8-CV12]|jgi:RNA polymerase sigma-70 factor (ECF subfamily)|nr:sigma-70 family RNA polymerase sigma factor [Trichocoleus desertorum ATA4-8-CV12]